MQIPMSGVSRSGFRQRQNIPAQPPIRFAGQTDTFELQARDNLADEVMEWLLGNHHLQRVEALKEQAGISVITAGAMPGPEKGQSRKVVMIVCRDDNAARELRGRIGDVYQHGSENIPIRFAVSHGSETIVRPDEPPATDWAMVLKRR